MVTSKGEWLPADRHDPVSVALRPSNNFLALQTAKSFIDAVVHKWIGKCARCQPYLDRAGSVRVPNQQLRTATQNGVLWAAVHCGRSVLRMRHRDFRGNGGAIAGRVSYLEGDGVDAPVTVTFPLRTHLHRLAVAGDHDVIYRVAISGTVIRFIAGNFSDLNAIDVHARVTKIAGARDQISYVDRHVFVVRRPQLDGL